MNTTSTNYKQMLEDMDVPIYFTNRDRQITFWNKSAEELTGFSADEVIGSSCADNILIHIDEQGNRLCGGMCPLAESLTRGTVNEARVYLHHKEGHRVPVRVRTTPMFDSNGAIIGASEVFYDLRGNNPALQRFSTLNPLDYFDSLTGLPNRRLLTRFANQRSRELTEDEIPFGVMLIDVDGMHAINEKYGRRMGDEVICLTARTLFAAARMNDMVGRWEEDSFVSVVTGVDLEQLNLIAQKNLVLVQFSELPGNPVDVTISIGITMAKEGETINAIADRIMQKLGRTAKMGANRIVVA